MITHRFVMIGCGLLTGITVLGATAPLKLITASSPALASATGNGESTGNALTPDGRYVAFTSYASNLTTNDLNQGPDVFRFDRQNQTLSLISINLEASGTGNGDSANAMVSDDGRYVAFESEADDLTDENDDNACSDIYVRDCLTGTTRLVSLKPESSEPANGPSVDPYLTTNGSQVFFQSQASNLVADDTNAAPDLFRRDLREPSLLLVSRYQDVPCGIDGAIPYAATPSGRYVLFVSASNIARIHLAPEVSLTDQEVLLRDVGEFYTDPVSRYARDLMAQVNTNFNPTNPSHSIQYSSLALSPNGRWAVFGASWQTTQLLLLHDHQGDRTRVVATNLLTDNISWTGDWEPSFSSDSHCFCYVSPHPSRGTILQLYDTEDHSQRRIGYPLTSGEEAFSQCATPFLDRTGSNVVFLSALDLTGTEHADAWNVYHQDLATGTLSWISSYATNQTGLEGTFLLTALSDDGQVVLFEGVNDRVVPNDRNRCQDVFVRDIRKTTIELASPLTEAGTTSSTANGFSVLSPGGMSEDGQRIVYPSLATTLAPGDDNQDNDIYLHDSASGTNVLISLNYLGTRAGNGSSSDPVISRDGRFVVFISRGSNLVPNDTNGLPDLFLRDTLNQTTECITHVPAITPTSSSVKNFEEIHLPRISPSGHYVAFWGKENTASTASLYLHNRSTNITWQITWPNQVIIPFSEDRDCLEFTDDDNWLVGAVSLGNTRFFRISLATRVAEVSTIQLALNPSISGDGNRIAFESTTLNPMVVWDFTTGSALFTAPSNPCWSPAISRDGRMLAYLTRNAAGASNGFTQVMLADLRTGNTMVISTNPITGALADQDCHTPLISRDNRRVVFVTKARNLTPETDDYEWNDVLVHDLYTGLIHLVSTTPEGKAGNYGSAGPYLSPDGQALSFSSSATDFVARDFNSASDLFTTHFVEEDSDEDGLPDDWEQAYWGATSAAPQEDPDLDGFTNQQELLLGTNPRAKDSYFQLSVVMMPNSSVRLTWVSAPGRTYQVQYTDQLANPVWTDLAAPVFAASSSTWLEDPSPPTGPTRFYRVVLVGSRAP